MSFIKFTDVTKEYTIGEQKIKAVKNISFEIEEGEFVVILGPSGAGKSTILNLLGGMDLVTTGKISISNKEITNYKDNELTNYRAKEVGFIFQFYNLIQSLTVYENVSLVKELTKDFLNVENIITSVGLDERKNLFPNQLSGGEQQRVSIARALCKNPKLLLCDEPTGALDTETGTSIISLLYETCKKNNKTVIIVTHNPNYSQIADKIIHVKNGKIKDIIINKNIIPVEEVNW